MGNGGLVLAKLGRRFPLSFPFAPPAHGVASNQQDLPPLVSLFPSVPLSCHAISHCRAPIFSLIPDFLPRSPNSPLQTLVLLTKAVYSCVTRKSFCIFRFPLPTTCSTTTLHQVPVHSGKSFAALDDCIHFSYAFGIKKLEGGVPGSCPSEYHICF